MVYLYDIDGIHPLKVCRASSPGCSFAIFENGAFFNIALITRLRALVCYLLFGFLGWWQGGVEERVSSKTKYLRECGKNWTVMMNHGANGWEARGTIT
jgi:hypothetical protein